MQHSYRRDVQLFEMGVVVVVDGRPVLFLSAAVTEPTSSQVASLTCCICRSCYHKMAWLRSTSKVGYVNRSRQERRIHYKNPDSESSLAIFSSSRSLGSTSKLLSYISCTSLAARIWSRIHSWRSGTGLSVYGTF